MSTVDFEVTDTNSLGVKAKLTSHGGTRCVPEHCKYFREELPIDGMLNPIQVLCTGIGNGLGNSMWVGFRAQFIAPDHEFCGLDCRTDPFLLSRRLNTGALAGVTAPLLTGDSRKQYLTKDVSVFTIASEP